MKNTSTSRRSRVRAYILFFVGGSAAFWAPDVVITWLPLPTRVWVGLKTVIPPLAAGGAWWWALRRPGWAQYRVGLPLWMLLGVWALGPLWMAAGFTAYDGGFAVAGPREILTLLAFFPLATYMGSAYSGTMFGLLIGTLFLIAAAIFGRLRRPRPVTPPPPPAPS